ncbi:SNAP25 ous protein SNAP33 [Zea mays]|uniref:SNAP25 ous protein SNAP33 n=1 Tax=Zea mays TaxID=4577 RepID=A0A3L6D6K0_MAIZE|nr:SNAP25 ous protein SNAP33 [Zea mays]
MQNGGDNGDGGVQLADNLKISSRLTTSISTSTCIQVPDMNEKDRRPKSTSQMNVTFSTRTSCRSNLILPFLLWWDQSDTKWPRTTDDDDDMATIAALRLVLPLVSMLKGHDILVLGLLSLYYEHFWLSWVTSADLVVVFPHGSAVLGSKKHCFWSLFLLQSPVAMMLREKIESWIFSRIVETIWWQTVHGACRDDVCLWLTELQPTMEGALARTACLMISKGVLGLYGGLASKLVFCILDYTSLLHTVERAKKDDALSNLCSTLGQLKKMAVDMDIEIDRQNKVLVPFSDDVDELNFRLKGVNQCGRQLLGK